jgi:hypothetical protein
MKKTISVLACIITLQTSAASPQQWKCMAFDAKGSNFEATGITIEKAMSASKIKCKADSNQANTCKSAQSYCEQVPLSGNDDRCLVTDDDGHAWDLDGDDSCKTAMEMCNRFIYLEGGAHGQCWVKHGGGGN